jgi:hypothetical protein
MAADWTARHGSFTTNGGLGGSAPHRRQRDARQIKGHPRSKLQRAPDARAARLDGLFVIHLDAQDERVATLEILGSKRRSPGFEVVVEGRPGADPRPWEQAGATCWFTRFSQFTTSIAQLRSVIEAGLLNAEGGAPGGVIAT